MMIVICYYYYIERRNTQRAIIGKHNDKSMNIVRSNAIIYYSQMKGKKKVKVRRLEGTPYLISENQKIAQTKKGSLLMAYNIECPSEPLVAKIINIQKSENIKSIETQLQRILKLPYHQNLVKYFEIKVLSEFSYCVIMEYCNDGCLSQRISDMTLMPQQKIWDFLNHFCRGYQVLIDAQIIHLGIKPNNILINNNVLKIADHGFIETFQIASNSENMCEIKDLLYSAPELKKTETKQINNKSDVFSLGCIVYQLAYDGCHPFLNEYNKINNKQQYFELFQSNNLKLRQKNKKGQNRSGQLRQLISRMLQNDYEKRITWQQLFQHKKININQNHKEKVDRPNNQKQNQMIFLKKVLIQVSKSSIFMEQLQQQPNSIQNSSQKFFSFEQILDKQDVKYIQHVMFRLKILFLIIIHCNGKINIIIRQNSKHKKLQNHITESIKTVVIEGLLYLLKNIEIIRKNIEKCDPNITKDIRAILDNDKERVLQEYKKELKVFKNIDEAKFMQTSKVYDLRRYEHCLYNLLTVYCDYYKEGKQILRIVISLLIDIYDTSLRLTQMTQKQKILWKNPDFEQIQTKMDEICMFRHGPHQLHNYLMSKQHITQKQLTLNLKRVGLLFE